MAPQREWFEKDYYKVLGRVRRPPPRRSPSAYRKLARELPPRRQPRRRRGRGALQGGLRRLRRGRRRRQAQGVRRGPPLGPMGGGRASQGPGGGFGGPAASASSRRGDLGDLLGGLFNRGGGGAPGRPPRGTGPQRGADLEAELHLSSSTRSRASPPPCTSPATRRARTCHGSGAKPGTAPRACAPVRRPGRRRRQPGLFSFSQPCPACGGRGSSSTTRAPPAGAAASSAAPARSRSASPPASPTASASGSRAGAGPGRNGGPPGDLYVVVRVAPPAVRPQGRRPHLTVPVTFPRPPSAPTSRCPPSTGRPVTVRIPAGTRPGAPSG
jgi:molecular chaperone DnaJ